MELQAVIIFTETFINHQM